MEELDAIKSELTKLVGRNMMAKAIRKLQKLPDEILMGRNNEVSMIQRKLKDVERKQRMNTIRDDEYDYQIGTITQGLLDIINGLGEKPEVEEDVDSPDNKPSVSTILFLASNPTDTGKLRLDKEIREIDEGLRRSSHRDFFKLEQRHAVRPGDLSRAMLDFEPQIIHFSGHGVLLDAPAPDADDTRAMGRRREETEPEDYSGGIVLQDDRGNMKIVSAQALGGLFGLFANKIKCVVLNACYSEAQADEIIKHVPYVIGMNTAIPDNTAIAFATGFYDALGDGKDIPFAFKFAQNRIMLEGLRGADIPQIRVRETENE